jgi:hypothetical protein
VNSSPDIFKQIETKYRFTFPQEYRQMWERGWFDFKKGTVPHSNPSDESYLWMNEMEWMPLADILDFAFPSYCKPGFVPFAFTGGGSYWCWYPEHVTNDAVPIVHCPRDSKIAEFYAPHFLGAVYRQILDFASNLDGEDESLARKHLKRWLDDLGPFFPMPWRSTLMMLLAAPCQSWEVGKFKRKQLGLLPPESYRSIVQRDLTFEKLNEEFQWMLD